MKGARVLPYIEQVIFQYTIIKVYLIAFVTANISGLSYTLFSLEYKLRKKKEQIQQTKV